MRELHFTLAKRDEKESRANEVTMALSLFGIPFALIVIAWLAICLQPTVAPQPPVRIGSDCDCDHANCHAQDTTANRGGTTTANAIDSVDDSKCTTATKNERTKSSSGDGKKWKWDPASESHLCNIRRISRLELLRAYGEEGLPNLYPYPLVIYPAAADDDDDDDDDGETRRAKFANLTSLENLPSNFPPDFLVTLTGSDSLSSHRRTIPLTRYLREVVDSNETLPNRLGNETWYLFGETFSDEWASFLTNFDPPPCHSCTPSHVERGLIALAFGVGNVGSGVQWHLHGPGFSETVHGRKHWVLYPPERRPEYDLDYASRHWMENAYPALEDWSDEDVRREARNHDDFLRRWKKGNASSRGGRDVGRAKDGEAAAERGPSRRKPWECTINEGEMIYFPDQWHHATINLAKYTVFVSSFTTEHEG